MSILSTTIQHSAGAASVASTVATFTLWGMKATDVSVILSGVAAVLTFVVYTWYTVRRDRREAAEARLRADLNDPEVNVVPLRPTGEP